MELSGVIVYSMYKPPPEPSRLPALGQRNKPHIVIGDFNSHNTLWGYHNKQRRIICWSMGGLKQPVTHTQRETTEIIQQCNMGEGIQPGSHLFFSRIYVRNRFYIQSSSPYLCDCKPDYCATPHHIQYTF